MLTKENIAEIYRNIGIIEGTVKLMEKESERIILKSLVSIRELLDRITEFPSAADEVEVVRCKDCKHFSAVSRICDHPDGLWLVVKPEDGYCCYGERRDA